jgi:hypothetical protein
MFVSCHRTPKRMKVSATISVAGMMFKAVALVTIIAAGLDILDQVAILLSVEYLVILTGAADSQALTLPTAWRATSPSGISKSAKARERRTANLQAQAIGMRATSMTTVDGMICKAVEAAMTTADGLAWMVPEVIQPNRWRREHHGGVAG